MNQAVALDPANTYYRTNRALLLRNQGEYIYNCIYTRIILYYIVHKFILY